MRPLLHLALLAAITIFPTFLNAQSSQPPLDPQNLIDWSQSGIPGGIPHRSLVHSTIRASDFANGAQDAAPAIQAALDSCPPGQVVQLSPGTFSIQSSLTIPSNVTLRGSGPIHTLLRAEGKGSAVIYIGREKPLPQPKVVTQGAARGSSTITLANASAIEPGSYLLITELNRPGIVTVEGASGTCTWCDPTSSGSRARGQIVEVHSRVGNTVHFDPPLYTDYNHEPLAYPFTPETTNAGIEELQIYATNSGYTTNILMAYSAYCWVRAIMGNYADGDHLRAYFSYRGEIRDSYFTNSYTHTPGNTEGMLQLAHKTTAFLVENNIFERLHTSIVTEWGAAGNVIAYNFSTAAFDAGSPDSVMMDLSGNHGAHPQFNLWEGNVAAKFQADFYWGSSSHITLFRNWLLGTTKICPPLRQRGPILWNSCSWATSAVRPICIDRYNLYYSLVANVVGSIHMSALTVPGTSGPVELVEQTIAPSYRPYTSMAFAFSWGYRTSGDTGTLEDGNDLPYATALLHGNYDIVSDTVRWAPGRSRDIPASLFRGSRPPWFGNVPWPPIGPSVHGGQGPSGHAYFIPAQLCHNSSPRDADGLLRFDPATCYPGSATTVVNPPRNLRVQ